MMFYSLRQCVCIVLDITDGIGIDWPLFMSFFLCGYLKDTVYSKNTETLEQLEQLICETGAFVSVETLQRATSNFLLLRHVIVKKDGHMKITIMWFDLYSRNTLSHNISRLSNNISHLSLNISHCSHFSVTWIFCRIYTFQILESPKYIFLDKAFSRSFVCVSVCR